MAKLTESARTLLEKRYLAPGETPDGMFDRVATALAGAEEDPAYWGPRFHEIMSDLRFLPNSPTLMNAGRSGTLSACFTFHVEDSMESIMGVGLLASKVLKYGGGVGYGLSNLRHKGAPVASTGGKARGPVAALRYYQSIGAFVEQAGKRDGAQMGILGCDHPDILDFIDCKTEHPEQLNTFNISVALTDAFMKNAGPELDSHESRVLDKMALSAWWTGDPGCYFIDAAERDNPTPWLGTLASTNPCGEVPLLHAEACNLGSINVAAYYRDDAAINEEVIDWVRLREDVALAVRMLDNAITINSFPDPLITEAVARTRKIGLGVMGWADLLALLHIEYDSDIAINLAGELASYIRKYADSTSMLLAHEKGAYPAYRWGNETCGNHEPHEVHFPDVAGCPGLAMEAKAGDLSYGYRNATRLCIAPTGSIAIIAGCSSGIEPHFMLEYKRTMGDGTEFAIKEPVMERIEGFTPKTAMRIPGLWHIHHQAAWQAHVDLAVSKTINLPNDASVAKIRKLYLDAWALGCKGLTIYRDGSREGQVLDAPRVSVADASLTREDTGDGQEPLDTGLIPGKLPAAVRVKLPRDRNAITHKFSVDGVEGYITVGLYENGFPGEVFININKEGSAIRGWADLTATLLSIGLQHGIPMELLVKHLRHARFEPAGLTGNSNVPFATSVPDYIGHWLETRFLSPVNILDQGLMAAVYAGVLCPQCGGECRMQEGCVNCLGCGWSRC